MKTVAEEVASKYQMGFPAATIATQPEPYPDAAPVAAPAPAREQDAATGRVTFSAPVASFPASPPPGDSELVVDLRRQLAVAQESNLEALGRIAALKLSKKTVLNAVVRMTTSARHSGSNEMAAHVTAIEKFAQDELRKS